MKVNPHEADLSINGQFVGRVMARGLEASWGFGDFSPLRSFTRFATLFGAWSLLMHADDDGDILSEVAAEELRHAEQAIDALKVELHWTHDHSVTRVEQINIDGALIEWKQAS